MLVLLAATIGTLVAAVRDAADVKVLAALLAAGQLLGHAVLGAVGHAHAAAAAPSGPMLAAHVAAVAAGTALIVVGGHLCATMCRVLRATSTRTHRPVASVPPLVVGSADQPLRSALLIAASMSHRGPPVSLAR